MPDWPDIAARVRELARQLAEPKPMRRGSLSVRRVKCGKPRCPCGQRAEARHGPYVSVVRVVDGQTRSRWVPADSVEQVRRQVETGQQFRKRVDAYWEACESWADAQLESRKPAAEGKAEKGGFKRRSRRRSSGKSRRL